MAVLTADSVTTTSLQPSGSATRRVTMLFGVTFNGEGGATISSQYRVTSVSRLAQGAYQINLPTNSGTNYCITAFARVIGTAVNSARGCCGMTSGNGSTLTTTRLDVVIHNYSGGGRNDAPEVGLVVFGE